MTLLTPLRLFIGTIFALSSALACAQSGHDQLSAPAVVFAAHPQAVPFDLFRGNRIVVRASINGHDTEAVLDTGASNTSFDRAFARSIGLPEGMKIQARGAGGVVDAELVSGVTVQIGGTRLEKMNVGVFDLAPVARSVGRPINVILGRDFFNAAVVTIDWVNNQLQISAPQAFRQASDAVPLALAKVGPFNTIPISIAGAPPINALLDLGNGNAVVLPRTYWNSRSEITSLRSAGASVGGVGGMHPARAALLPQVSLAGRTFSGVPALLSESGNDFDPTQMANVGIGLLRQFKVDLDLGRNRIYLAPRADMPGFDRDRAGVRFDFAGDRLKVVFVSPEGPAAAAGLKKGDEIVAVDGRAVTANYYAQGDWTRGTVGKKIVLDRADGTKVTVTLANYY